jgi:2-aminoadipate transaminase
LDASSDEPLYRQLYEYMRSEIATGHLAAGARVPPTRELAGLLGLNRTTVASAYELLEADGLIRGHVGRGSFVAGHAAAPNGIEWEDRFVAARLAEAPTSSQPVEISFVAARPADELLPLDAFRAACAEVIDGAEASSILQLGSPYGYAPLRAWLLEQGRQAGFIRESDDLLITNGCQQALDLLERLLTGQGDTVLIEDPVYPGLRNVFLRAGVRALGVPVGEDGIDIEAAARLMAREHPRLIVVTPNFQNPTGTTMPLAARRALLAAAREWGVVVVENDIYGELRYTGEAVASLKQLDATGDVLQIKSYSKLAFPGLRVGWLSGPRTVVARLAELKQTADLHSDQLSQAVLLRFAASGRLAVHRERIVAAGAERLAALLGACARYLPPGTRFTRPQGGMNLWVRLPEPLDATELLAAARAAGVAYLPGRHFAVSRPEPGGLRLSFAGLTPARIEAGLARLGRVFGDECERGRSTSASGLAPVIT